MNESEAAPGPRSPARSTWLVAVAAAVALVAVGAAAVLLVGDRSESEYPADSPESAFQAFVQSWEEGAVDEAWAALGSEAHERHTYERFHSANQRQPDDAYRIWIDDVLAADDKAVLHVTVESLVDDGLLGPDRERVSRNVTMVREDGAWKVQSPTIAYYW
jgi:hypothetical protein